MRRALHVQRAARRPRARPKAPPRDRLVARRQGEEPGARFYGWLRLERGYRRVGLRRRDARARGGRGARGVRRGSGRGSGRRGRSGRRSGRPRGSSRRPRGFRRGRLGVFQRVRFGVWREEELLQVRGAARGRPRGRGAGRARGRSARAEARAVLASSRDCSEDDGLVLQPGNPKWEIHLEIQSLFCVAAQPHRRPALVGRPGRRPGPC